VGVAAFFVLLGVVLSKWWPWDGYRFARKYGIDVPELPDGWYAAPFLGPFFLGVSEGGRHIFYAFVAQLVPLAPAQALACERLTPNPSDVASQLYMGFYLKGIDTAAWALRRFPENKELQRACVGQAAASSLFNHLACGAVEEAGIVDLALAAFRRFAPDPEFQNLGNLGCFFDHCPRNVQRFGELGGIALVHEIAKAHYNNSLVQFNAFCAFSSGCAHANNAACGSEPGLIGFMAGVMRDHRQGRVREEVMQVVKSVAAAGPEFRGRLVQAGMVPQVVQVLEERTDSKTDQSVACEALGALLGVDWQDPGLGSAAFRPGVQALMAEAGAPRRVAEALDLAGTLALHEGFGGQNAEALSQYNVGRACAMAAFALAAGHPANQGELVRLGLPAKIAAMMQESTQDDGFRLASCAALHALSEDGAANRLAVEAAKAPSCVGIYPRGA